MASRSRLLTVTATATRDGGISTISSPSPLPSHTEAATRYHRLIEHSSPHRQPPPYHRLTCNIVTNHQHNHLLPPPLSGLSTANRALPTSTSFPINRTWMAREHVTCHFIGAALANGCLCLHFGPALIFGPASFLESCLLWSSSWIGLVLDWRYFWSAHLDFWSVAGFWCWILTFWPLDLSGPYFFFFWFLMLVECRVVGCSVLLSSLTYPFMNEM